MIRPGTVLLALPLLVCACSEGVGEFRLLEVIPPPGGGALRLNEPLTFVFSENVDPSSVGSDAVSILAADGIPVDGRLETAADLITFVPAPIRSAASVATAYGGGSSVSVRLRGFPSRSGVLSAAGEPLTREFDAHVAVVERNRDAPPSALFVDVVPGSGPRIVNAGRLRPPGQRFARVRPGGRIRLEFSEPLWPGSVSAATIRLLFDNPDQDVVATEFAVWQDERWGWVELWPQAGFSETDIQSETRYLLVLGDLGVTDLAGTAFEPESVGELPIRVLADGAEVVGKSR